MEMLEEALPENVKSGIIEVLVCKTGRVDHGEARILSINDMLLNQLNALLIVQTFLLFNAISQNV